MKRFLFMISFFVVALAVIAQGALADDSDCCGCCCLQPLSSAAHKALGIKEGREWEIEQFGIERVEYWENTYSLDGFHISSVIE